MHDATALRTEGIEGLLRSHPGVTADVDSGYQGLARDFPGQVTAPPKKPKTDATPAETASREQQRKAKSSRRICIEHAIAEPKQWRTLQRYTGRREYFGDTALATAGLVSDRTAERRRSPASHSRPAHTNLNRAPSRDFVSAVELARADACRGSS